MTQIAQLPGSCGLMDAKSGKSFLVNGLGSGNDLKFGEKAVAISIKKSHTLIVIKPFSDEHMSPSSPITWVMDA